jgi:hypothetical protein
MTVVGDAAMWSDTFPEDLLPQILALVVETWAIFPKPSPTEHEVPITRRFKHAIRQAKTLRGLPFRIDRETAEDDPVTGEELGRIDLKLSPAGSAVEEVYFAFECKRVNARKNGRWRSLASEYVHEGMLRFVEQQYACNMRHGGIIGYILDGHADRAIQLVERNVRANAGRLRMCAPASLGSSQLRPNDKHARETAHTLSPSRVFRIHHLFLACTPSRLVRGRR